MSIQNIKTNQNDYPSNKEDYEILEKIGKGSYGRVVLAKILTGKYINEKVAIKILDLDNYEIDNWKTIEKELNILRLVNHKNIISSLLTFVSGTNLHLVMPFMDGGSCSDIIKSRYRLGFEDEILVSSILKEALEGLKYLHEDGRIHRDVKSGNILLSTDGSVKIADFGVSGCLVEAGEKKGSAQTFTGTPCWMAPEVIKQEKGYDYKADIWSFGITALELAFGKPPYADYSPMKVLVCTLQKKPPNTSNYGDRSNKFSRSFKNMVEICLKRESIRRPTAKELLKQKFFKKAMGKDYIKKKLFSVKIPQKAIITNRESKVITNESKKKAVSIGVFDFEEESIQKKPKTKKAPSQESRFKVEIEEKTNSQST